MTSIAKWNPVISISAILAREVRPFKFCGRVGAIKTTDVRCSKLILNPKVNGGITNFISLPPVTLISNKIQTKLLPFTWVGAILASTRFNRGYIHTKALAAVEAVSKSPWSKMLISALSITELSSFPDLAPSGLTGRAKKDFGTPYALFRSYHM